MSRHASILAFAAILGSTAALAGCDMSHFHGKPVVERTARPVSGPAPVATETADTNAVVAPGTVEPWGAQVELAAPEPGRIAEIAVREGDVVQAGQTLARLDDTAQQHGVDLARADMAEAEAALARIDRGTTPEELRQAGADSAAASARGELAVSVAARSKRLREDGVVADDEVERTTADARAQTALAERAAARLAELRRGPRAEDRAAARARVEAAGARLRVAEDGLARRRVVAPSAGTVLLSRYHAGEFYGPQSGSLFVIGDMSRLQVRLEVDEIDASAVEPAAPCAIYSDAGVRLSAGTVVRLAPRMGRRSLPLESPTARADVRVREVFVEVPAASGLLPSQRVWGHTARTAKAGPTAIPHAAASAGTGSRP